ncbi:hypothetical protein Tco_0250517 [Tanacetum coccineum]
MVVGYATRIPGQGTYRMQHLTIQSMDTLIYMRSKSVRKSQVDSLLREKIQLQDSLRNYADPVLLLSYIREKSETLAGDHVGVYSGNLTEAVDEVAILAGLSADIYFSVHADKLEVNRRVVSKNLEGNVK